MTMTVRPILVLAPRPQRLRRSQSRQVPMGTVVRVFMYTATMPVGQPLEVRMLHRLPTL